MSGLSGGTFDLTENYPIAKNPLAGYIPISHREISVPTFASETDSQIQAAANLFTQSPAITQARAQNASNVNMAQQQSQIKAAQDTAAKSSDPVKAANQAQSVADILDPKMSEQFASELEAALPGYKNIVQSMSKATQDMISGKLPGDVQAQISQMTAEKNLQGGRYGGIAGNLTARDLGLTSLQLSQQGQVSAKSLLELVTTKLMPPQIDVSKIFSENLSSNLSAGLGSAKIGESGAGLSSQGSLESARLASSNAQFSSNQAFEQEMANWNKQFENFALKYNMDKEARSEAMTMNQYGQSRAQAFM